MRSHANGSEVMAAIKASLGAEHAQGRTITGTQRVTREPQKERATQVGTKRGTM